jgi:hypothetical protein
MLIPGFSWQIPAPIVLFTPGLQRPRPRGHLRLTTADPNVPPEIHIKLFQRAGRCSQNDGGGAHRVAHNS